MAKNEDEQNEAIQKAVKAALEGALPVVAGVMAQTMAQTQLNARSAELSALQNSRPSGERCQDCRQYLPAGCKQGEHKHRQVVCLPKASRHAKYFRGAIINGVCYLSNNPGHKVTVPADCNIEHIIQEYEANEEIQANGREAEHDSGSATKFVPAQSAWR